MGAASATMPAPLAFALSAAARPCQGPAGPILGLQGKLSPEGQVEAALPQRISQWQSTMDKPSEVLRGEVAVGMLLSGAGVQELSESEVEVIYNVF